MNHNSTKIFIPLLLMSLVLVFCISTVSADSSMIYVNNETGNDSYNGQSPTYNATTGDGPKLSIKNATETVSNNGVVSIADGMYSGANNTNIIVNKNVSFTGQNQTGTIIDAENLAQIFTIQNGANVTMIYLTLANGNTASNGGAILNNGELIIVNCTFTGNKAPSNIDGNGGAIFNTGNLTVTNSIFQGNTASKGGSIYNREGILTLNNSTIEHNIATVTSSTLDVVAAGAGIFNDVDSTMTIDDCIIQNNNVNASGDSVNVAASGGGICNRGTLLIGNSIIQKNSATATATSQLDTVSADGGGIYNDNVLIMNNSTIQNNTVTANADNDVTANGAGIFNNGDMAIDCCKIQYNNIIINTAAGVGAFGGGIQNGGNLYINDTIIQYNTITSTTPGINRIGGGAISNSFAGNLYIDTSTIQHNTVAAIDGNQFAVGGGIYNENVLIMNNSTMAFNTVTATDAGEYAPLGGGICNFGMMIANFNRIVYNSPGAVHNDAETVPDLQYNWWGSNTPEFSEIITGTSADYTPWLVMRYTANPTTILQGSTSTLTADFRYDSDGVFHDPALGHLPDGTVVTFTTNLGNVGSKIATTLTIDGIATILLRGDEAAGYALTSAILDQKQLYATVQITAAPVNGASSSKTVGMQTTGAPLTGIILAILMLVSGFFGTQKKQ